MTNPQRFHLMRWFGVTSCLTIAAVDVVFALVLSHYITREALVRDAQLTGQFIASLAKGAANGEWHDARAGVAQVLDHRIDPATYGMTRQHAAKVRREFLDRVTSLPDTRRVNVYGRDRQLIWSTDPALVGRPYEESQTDLNKAFESRVAVAQGYPSAEHPKPKRLLFIGAPESFVVDNYIPLAAADGKVATVIEIYKVPTGLIDTIQNGYVLVAGMTAIGTIVVYLALFWFVLRLETTLNTQNQQLRDKEALTVIGEISSAVAHSLRNRMAAIRSSAELALGGDLNSVRRNARDIIQEVDRLSDWVHDMLTFSRPVSGESEALDVRDILHQSLLNFDFQFESRGVQLDCNLCAGTLPRVAGNGKMILQVFNSVIGNACDAMPDGGRLKVTAEAAEPGRVRVVIGDTGRGMSERQLENLFKPFHTTKRGGVGLGLAMAKHSMERAGGSISVRSRENEGTEVELDFKTVA